jgi:hypothetical protein
MVQEYRGPHRQDAYRKEAEKLAKKGWTVVAVEDVKQRIGGMRWVTLGPGAFVFPPHPILVVTYKREAPR